MRFATLIFLLAAPIRTLAQTAISTTMETMTETVLSRTTSAPTRFTPIELDTGVWNCDEHNEMVCSTGVNGDKETPICATLSNVENGQSFYTCDTYGSFLATNSYTNGITARREPASLPSTVVASTFSRETVAVETVTVKVPPTSPTATGETSSSTGQPSSSSGSWALSHEWMLVIIVAIVFLLVLFAGLSTWFWCRGRKYEQYGRANENPIQPPPGSAWGIPSVLRRIRAGTPFKLTPEQRAVLEGRSRESNLEEQRVGNPARNNSQHVSLLSNRSEASEAPNKRASATSGILSAKKARRTSNKAVRFEDEQPSEHHELEDIERTGSPEPITPVQQLFITNPDAPDLVEHHPTVHGTEIPVVRPGQHNSLQFSNMVVSEAEGDMTEDLIRPPSESRK